MSAVFSAHLVADGVAHDRRDHDERAERDHVDVSLARDDARHDDRSFAGEDKSNEQRSLSKDEKRDEAVDEDARQVLNLFEKKGDDRRAGHVTIVVDETCARRMGC